MKDINSYEVLFYKLIICDCPLFCDASVPDRRRDHALIKQENYVCLKWSLVL